MISSGRHARGEVPEAEHVPFVAGVVDRVGDEIVVGAHLEVAEREVGTVAGQRVLVQQELLVAAVVVQRSPPVRRVLLTLVGAHQVPPGPFGTGTLRSVSCTWLLISAKMRSRRTAWSTVTASV